MRLESLKVGKGIEIYVTRAGYRYRLVSTIEEVGKDKIYITLITSGMKVFRFLDSDIVDILYRDGARMVQWLKVIGSIEILEGTKVHCFTSREDGVSFNRRKTYRVDIGEDIVTYLFRPEEEEENASSSALKEEEIDEYGNELGTITVMEFEGYLKDLSENGAGFYTNEVLNIGDTVGFPLFTTFGAMYFKAEIVRHVEGHFGKYMEFYGCKFVRSNKNLGKYLFSLQRERLRKQRQGD